jgi:hypothetical protein
LKARQFWKIVESAGVEASRSVGSLLLSLIFPGMRAQP